MPFWKGGIPKKSVQIGPAQFEFLNLRGEAEKTWSPQELPRLWRYNLHYFDALNAADSQVWQSSHHDLMESWIQNNPPGSTPGWEPYPASQRIVNWVKWSMRARGATEEILRSLGSQAWFLDKTIEFDVRVNHILANAKALIFASAVLTGRHARKWRAKGIALLERELPQQVLPDGGHVERSPMYHAIVLEDLLDLVALSTCVPALLPDRLARYLRSASSMLLSWLLDMTHPDGGVAFFNDCALGVAPDTAQLVE